MMIDAMMGDGWTAFAVGVALKGALVLLLATAATFVLRRGSAAARHWVWLLGLVGLLVLPAVSLSIPGWSFEVPTRRAPGVERASAPEVGGGVMGGVERPTPAEPVVRAEGVAVSPASSTSRAEWSEERAVMPVGSTPAARTRDRAAGPPPLAGVLLLLWVGGAAALLVRLTVSHVALRRLEARARPMTSERVTRTLRALSERVGLGARVRLYGGGVDAMPMSWGVLRPSILLPSGAPEWGDARLSSVLLHELAHVRRRDCLSQLVAEVAVALHWPNPLAWLAAHRLRVEREHACDDAVLLHGARASGYASELVALARELRTLPSSVPAGVAMLGPAHLRERIRAVLDASRPRSLGRRAAVGGAVLAAGVVGLLGAVTPVEAVGGPARALGEGEPLAVAVTPSLVRGDVPRRAAPSRPGRGSLVATMPQGATCGLATEGWRRSSVQSNDDHDYRLSWERRGCTVDVRIEGEVTFAGDFRDVERLDRGAFVRIEEDDDGTRRWLEITPDASGRPQFEYRLDRDDHAFDAAARAWYEAMLLQIFRRSGLMAQERVASMLRNGGVQSVLDEIALLDSDHVFSRYVVQLIEQADLTEAQAVALVDRARARVDSDHYMSEILLALADRHLDSERGMDAFLGAAGTLESDHYRAQVLGHALDRRELTEPQVAALIDEVSGMESDHYVSEVLRGVAGRYFLDDQMRSRYLRAVSTVESDHYRTEILSTLLDRNDLDAAERTMALEAVAGMESDHYKTEILRRMGAGGLGPGELSAYLDIVASMESDHYQSESLRDVPTRDLPAAAVVEVIRVVESMDGDHYKAEILTELARTHGSAEGAVRDALVDAMESIGSRHYRGQVAEVLLRR